MRVKIRRAFYTLSVLNLLVFMVYLYGLASKVPTSIDKQDVIHSVVTPRETSTIHRIETTPLFPTIQFHNRTGGKCPNLKRPTNVVDVQKWQSIDSKKSLYVISAFYDDAGKTPIVRLLALSQGGAAGIMCQLWFMDTSGEDLHETEAQIQKIPEDHGRRYSASYIKCPLPEGSRPYAVSIVRGPCVVPTNYMMVIYSDKPLYDFSVCVTPFNFKYSRAYELVEMIEFNRLLGADMITFYNHSTGPNVDAVLRHYQNEGLVEVVQWRLPMKVDTWPPSGKPEVHYFAQLASLNDCLYRHLHRSKYLVFTDMDEFVVPKKDKNWNDLIQKKVATNANIGAFIFRCNFFRKDWPKIKTEFEGRTDAEKFKSILLLNVLRENKAFNYFQRSKYIVVPSRIETVGIHNIWGQRPGFQTARVDAADALLHHYRSWENPEDGQKRVEDLGIHQYKEELLARLRATWDSLQGVEIDIPISSYKQPV